MTDDVPVMPDVVRRALAGVSDAADQLQAFRSLSASRQEIVLRRLTALEAYRRAGDRTKEGAAAAAEQAGLKPRAFYKLLAEVSRLGPVIGSAPYAQRSEDRKLRKAPIRDGFIPEAEEEIRRALGEDPNMPFSRIQARVIGAFKESGKKPPSVNTVRRRLQNLRGEAGRYFVAGRELIIIQEVTSRAEATGWDTDRQYATIILDADTRLVLSLSIDADEFTSLDAALTDSRCIRVKSLSHDGVPFSKVPTRLAVLMPEENVIRLMPNLRVMDQKGVSSSARPLTADDAERWLEPIFGKAVNTERLEKLLLAKSFMLGRYADAWNARILTSGKRRARNEVDEGEGVINVMAALAEAMRSIRIAV